MLLPTYESICNLKAMSTFENSCPVESETKVNKTISSDSDEDTEKHNDSISPHVMQVRQRLERCLRHLGLTPFSTKFIIQYISSILQKSDHQTNPLPHVLPYLLQLLQPRPGNDLHVETLQLIDRKGCPQIIPDLAASPFWDSSLFSWVPLLESHATLIKEEFLHLRNSLAGFQKYRSADDSETTDRGHWHVCYLSLHGMDFSDNVTACPKTMEIISSIPRFYHHAFFSALDKSTHVTAHYGPTNKKLRVFLPLFVPEDSCWIRVNHETRYLQEGKVMIFDDSFYHEAGNDSDSHPRIVLILDVWHPDLTDAEVKILEFINKGQISAAKRLTKIVSEEAQKQEQNEKVDNFLTTITTNKKVGITEEDAVRIWGEYMSLQHK